MSTDENLKKHVAAIHISNRLSLLERKISNVFLWNAYDELLTHDKHRMRVKDLAEMIGFASNDREMLKTALKSLISTVLEWSVLDGKGREKDWEACTMLDYARISGSYCYYSYPNILRQKLYNPAMYERINISIQRKFSSGYALALYENCVRFRKLGHTGWIPLEVFRKLMGVGPLEYQDFRRLNFRVIKEPIKQINRTSDIIVTAEYQRDKRRIVAVRFLVKDNPQLSLFKNNKCVEEVTTLSAGKVDYPLLQRLQDFGLSRLQAEATIRGYSSDYIEGNLVVVERLLEAGKIRTTLTAATLDALKKDYRPKQTAREAELMESKTARRRERAVAEKRHDEEEEQLAVATRELEEALVNLMPGERQELEDEFTAAIESGALPGGTFFQEQFRLSGFDSIIVQSMFRNFARERLLATEK
jgi:hypothetical protein